MFSESFVSPIYDQPGELGYVLSYLPPVGDECRIR